MRKIFKNQTFRGLEYDDRDSARILSDLSFENCTFQGLALSITFDPEKRTTVRNMQLIKCHQKGCAIWPAIIEDVTVDGLDTGRLLIANACAYKHVVLHGKVGNIKICRSVPWISAPKGFIERKQEAMDRANAEYYKGVDWALDISEAEFESGEVEGVPVDLVRRDPATQFIVRGQAIKEGRWRQVEAARADWHILLDAYDKENMGDVILIAPKAAPDFAALLKGLMALRETGIAEPN